MASVQTAISTMVKNIEDRTGKTMKEWLALCRASGASRHGEILAWLKHVHGVGHGYANFIAKEALKPEDASAEDLVAEQYGGKKAALRPLYEALVEALLALGPDVEIAPKKHNVSIRRSKQFALLQPSTASRLDVGLILPELPPTSRLEASGSFNAMFTHRVRIATADEIDLELRSWIKAAYEAA